MAVRQQRGRQVAQSQKVGQLGRIATVGLDAVATFHRNQRRGDNVALVARRRVALVGDSLPGLRQQQEVEPCRFPFYYAAMAEKHRIAIS